jgi:hypothetical protein
MLDGHLEGDTASHAVADDAGLLDAEVLHQRSDVIRYLLVLLGAVDVGGAAMALQSDSDNSPTFGQFRQQSVHHAGRHLCVVEQDDRHAATRATNGRLFSFRLL